MENLFLNLLRPTHGGTGFFIKDNVDYKTRKDLQINSPGHYESKFIEINFPRRKNLIVGSRHPSSDISIQDFANIHLDPTLQKISAENKQCVLMRPLVFLHLMSWNLLDYTLKQ